MFSFGMFLPTPSTVGLGRKQQKKPVLIRGRNLLASLKALAPPQASLVYASPQHSPTHYEEAPSTPKPLVASDVGTPKKNIISDELVHQWHGSQHKSLYSDIEDEDEINHILSLKNSPNYKKNIPNPFVDNSSSILDSHPFGISIDRSVDYSTQAEFINKKGQRVVRQLLERERRLKPKRLDFGVPQPPAISTDVPPAPSANPFVSSSASSTNIPGTTPRPKPAATTSPFSTPLMRAFERKDTIGKKYVNRLTGIMGDPKPKGSPGFEIFKDYHEQ